MSNEPVNCGKLGKAAGADELRALLARLEAAKELLDPEAACRLHALGEDEAFFRYSGEGYGDGGASEHEYEVERVPGDYSSSRYVLARDLPDRSLDAAASLLDRFGMSWSKSMEGFVCVHDREGAGTFRPDTESTALPIKLVAAAVRALLARAETGAADATE